MAGHVIPAALGRNLPCAIEFGKSLLTTTGMTRHRDNNRFLIGQNKIHLSKGLGFIAPK